MDRVQEAGTHVKLNVKPYVGERTVADSHLKVLVNIFYPRIGV